MKKLLLETEAIKACLCVAGLIFLITIATSEPEKKPSANAVAMEKKSEEILKEIRKAESDSVFKKDAINIIRKGDRCLITYKDDKVQLIDCEEI